MRIETVLGVGLFVLLTQAAHADALRVVVTDVEESRGEIRLALFDSVEAFENDGAPHLARIAEAASDQVTFVLEGVTPGAYAIKLFHDVNSNGELDRNMMNMPKERYGFSNNAGRFGPPSWVDAVFEVGRDTATEINIKLR